jgi:hypothetical protein
MSAWFGRLFLTSLIVIGSHTLVAAADDDSDTPTASEDIVSSESQSNEPAPATLTSPAEPGRVGDNDSGGAATAMPAGFLDPGSKCAEFPQMCTGQ